VYKFYTGAAVLQPEWKFIKEKGAQFMLLDARSF